MKNKLSARRRWRSWFKKIKKGKKKGHPEDRPHVGGLLLFRPAPASWLTRAEPRRLAAHGNTRRIISSSVHRSAAASGEQVAALPRKRGGRPATPRIVSLYTRAVLLPPSRTTNINMGAEHSLPACSSPSKRGCTEEVQREDALLEGVPKPWSRDLQASVRRAPLAGARLGVTQEGLVRSKQVKEPFYWCVLFLWSQVIWWSQPLC